jgi:hypothetical protein
MTILDTGEKLAALCRQGKIQEAIDRCYSPAVESVEPCARRNFSVQCGLPILAPY